MIRYLKCIVLNICIIYYIFFSFNLDSCFIKFYIIDNFLFVFVLGLIGELFDL